LLVLLYHAGIPGITGGYVGVDIFFVISGFLIGGGLYNQAMSQHGINLLGFYAKRARRILPAALVAIAATLLLTIMLLPSSRWNSIAGEATGSALYYANWLFAASSTDYLSQDDAESPLQHFWSLSVEEQFYIGLPFVLLGTVLLARSIGGRRPQESKQRLIHAMTSATVAVIAGSSLLHSVYLTASNPGVAYFATTTRAYELAIGVLVAIHAERLSRLPRLLALALGWAGAAFMIGSGLVFTSATVFPGTAALLPTLGAAAVIVSGMNGRQNQGIGALLSFKPAVWIGNISYSLYLWHWPLIIVATYQFDGLTWQMGGLIALLSFVPAWMSYRYIERPCLKWEFTLPPLRAIQVGMVATLTLAVATFSLDIYSARQTAAASAMTAAAQYSYVAKNSSTRAPETLLGAEMLMADPSAGEVVDKVDTLVPEPAVASSDHPPHFGKPCHQEFEGIEANTCAFGDRDSDFSVLLVGDSHAAQWLPAVIRLAEEQSWSVSSMTKSACPFIEGPVLREGRPYGECETWNQAVLEKIRSMSPDLVLTSSSFYQAPQGYEVADGLAGAWENLEDASVPYLVIKDTYSPGYDVPECLERNRDSLSKCAFSTEEAMYTGQREQTAALRALGSDRFLDLGMMICPEDMCPAVLGGAVVYKDTNHLTATFAASLAPSMGEAMKDQGIEIHEADSSK